MSTSAAASISPQEIPTATRLPQAAAKLSKTAAVVRQFFRSIRERLHVNHGSKFVVTPPLPLRKLVPICLDLASTAFVPIDEALSKKLPMANLGIATIQGIIGLRSIGKKVTKAAKGIKANRRLIAQLRSARHDQRRMTEPEAQAQLEIRIQKLQKQIVTSRSHIFSLRSIPASLANIASCGLTGIRIIAQKVGTVSQSILSGLQLAATIAGAAAGGLAVLLGGLETALGIRHMRQAYQEKKTIDTQIARFDSRVRSETGIPDNVWSIIRTIRGIQLHREALKANKHFQLSLLRASGGSLATIAGALGIGAAFTAGVAATGIAVSALVIGMIGLGVSIGSYFMRRRLKSEMSTMKVSNAQFKELLAFLKSPDCTEMQKDEIACLLGIDSRKLVAANIHLPHELRKLLCSDTDIKELAQYLCTGQGSGDQKIKFAQMLDAPPSKIFDRKRLLEDFLKSIVHGITPSSLLQATTYFTTRNPSQAVQEDVAPILGLSPQELSSPQSALETILREFLCQSNRSS